MVKTFVTDQRFLDSFEKTFLNLSQEETDQGNQSNCSGCGGGGCASLKLESYSNCGGGGCSCR